MFTGYLIHSAAETGVALLSIIQEENGQYDAQDRLDRKNKQPAILKR